MSSISTRLIAGRRLVFLGAAFALSILSCGREPTAPGGGASTGAVKYSQGLSWIAQFPSGTQQFQAAGGSGVAFTKVRVVLNNPDGSIALDTLIDFPPGATDLQVTLSVVLPASAPASGQPLALNLDYQNSSGQSVFHGGPVTVTAVPAVPGGPPPPPSQVQIPITYTGPGANAASVRISPKAVTVGPGAALAFSAQALDAAGNVVPNTPIVFNTSNATVATINAATGVGTAGSARGSATITAQLLTGPTDGATVNVVPPPSAIALVSGGGQTANVNATLANPIVARVTAADGQPSPGVTVTFAAGNGGSVGSASVVTDANGQASTTWKLGPTPGAQTLTVSSGSLSGSPITVGATARAIDPVRLVIAAQPPSSVGAGTAFGLTVNAVDATGALTPTFTGPVSVALGAGAPDGATFSGTTTVNAVAGVATFNDLKLTVLGAHTLVVGSPGLVGATSTSITVVPGAATKLVFQNYPVAGAVAGNGFDAITVVARDAFNNTVTSFTGSVSIGVGAAAAAATSATTSAASGSSTASATDVTPLDSTHLANAGLTGTTVANAVAGVATFTGLRITTAGTYAFVASSSGLTSASGPAFTISAGPASALIAISGGGQSGAGGAALAAPIVVKVSDAFGNAVAGKTVTFTPVAGSVSPTSGVSNGSGTVQTTWTLGLAGGTQTLNATSPGLLPSPLAITATSTAPAGGVATQLAITTGPTGGVAGVPVTPTIVVTVKDALNVTMTTYTGNVTLAITANPGGATLGGTTTVAAVAGVATFSNIRFNKIGTGYTLTASSAALTNATTLPFNITAAPAVAISADSGNAQSGLISAPLPAQLVARVVDSLGNPVAGTSVTWAVTGGAGTLSPTGAAITDANGRVRTTWTLGATPGANTATATSAGLTGSPLTFTATGAAAAVSFIWTGTTSTAWNVATNWSPNGVPTALDSVQIVTAANQPVLSANTALKHLYIATGATLNVSTFTLTVTGNLDAGNTITGTGSVLLTGTGSLKGTINAPVTINSSGTVSLGGTTTFGSTLTISSGQLAVGTSTMNVTGALATTGTGTIAMSSVAGTIIAASSVTFGGGSETGLISAGSITVAGNLTSVTNGYQGSGTAMLIFNGAASQSVSGNGQQFQSLNFNGAGGVVFAPTVTNSNINGAVTIQAASGPITGHAHLYLNTGSMTEAGTPGKWQVDSLSFGGCACAVTLPAVMHGLLRGMGNVSLGSSFTVDSMEIYSGTMTWNGKTVTTNGIFRTKGNGDLLMSNALDALTVNGDAFFTGGPSDMTAGTTTLQGNFTQTPLPSNVSGRTYRAQSGHTTILAGAGAQAVSFVNFDTSLPALCGQSCFGNLTVSKSAGTVTFNSPAAIQGDLNVTSGVTIVSALGTTGNARNILVKGTSTTAAGTGVHFTNFTANGTFALDTATVIDSIGYGGTAAQTTLNRLTFAQVTIKGTPTVGADMTILGDLVVDGGTFTLNGFSVIATGSFSTVNGGKLQMINGADYLGVQGNATFAGGSTAGLLTAGWMEVFGNFTQGGGATDAFAADTTFETDIGYNPPSLRAGLRARAPARTAARPSVLASRAATVAEERRASLARTRRERRRAELVRLHPASLSARLQAGAANALPQGVTFVGGNGARFASITTLSLANPGPSHFGMLYIAGSEIDLLSDVAVAAELGTNCCSTHLVSSSPAHIITSHGADIGNLEFANTQWVLLDGSPVWWSESVTFSAMDPTVAQFTVQRDGNPPVCDCSTILNLDYWTFTTVPTSGTYISATDTDGPTPNALTISMYQPDPAFHGGFVATLGGATFSNWLAAAPLFSWTGATSTSWNVGANWSGGVVPTSSDDVIIPAAPLNQPELFLTSYAHNLTIEAGASIYTSCNDLNVYGNVVAALGAPAVTTCDGDALNLVGDGSPFNTVVGNFDLVNITGNYKISGTGNRMIVSYEVAINGTGNLEINGGRLDANSLSTNSAGTLTMKNAADQVFVTVSGAFFNGASTDGLLTAGTITVSGNAQLSANSSNAFAPSGTHTTVFAGTTNYVAFVDPTMSYFQNLTVNGGTTVQLQTYFNANGTFSRGAGAAPMVLTSVAAGPLISNVSGLNITGGPTTMNDAGLRLFVGATGPALNTVTFTGFAGFTGPILTVNRSSPEVITFNGLDFSGVGVLGTGGVFLDNSSTGTVNVRSSTPGTGTLGTHYTITGGGTVSWIP